MSNDKPSKFAGLITSKGITSQPAQPAAPAPLPQKPEPQYASRPIPAAQTSVTAGKRKDPNYVQISAYVKRRLYTDVRKALLDQEGREVSDLLEQLLTEWLKTGCPSPHSEHVLHPST